MLRKKLFGKNIEQSCDYCENSECNEQGEAFCKIHKHINRTDKCNRFRYDPLKRKPYVEPQLPKYNPEDFSI